MFFINISPSLQDADNRGAHEDPDDVWDQDAAGQPGRLQLRGAGPGRGQGEGLHGHLLAPLQGIDHTHTAIPSVAGWCTHN